MTRVAIIIAMGKRREKHPFEDNPFIDGFQEWTDSPEGQLSIYAHDLAFAALANAGADPRGRKIVWGDGNGCRSSSRRNASMPSIRMWPSDLIEVHVVGWLESCAPETCSESQLEEFDRLAEEWLDDYERNSRGARK